MLPLINTSTYGGVPDSERIKPFLKVVAIAPLELIQIALNMPDRNLEVVLILGDAPSEEEVALPLFEI